MNHTKCNYEQGNWEMMIYLLSNYNNYHFEEKEDDIAIMEKDQHLLKLLSIKNDMELLVTFVERRGTLPNNVL
jgi:hypothetical protein